MQWEIGFGSSLNLRSALPPPSPPTKNIKEAEGKEVLIQIQLPGRMRKVQILDFFLIGQETKLGKYGAVIGSYEFSSFKLSSFRRDD